MKRIFLPLMVLALFLSSTACAYTPDYLNVFWNSSVKETMSGLDAADLDGDGSLEIVVSASSEGMVYAFEPTGGLAWKYSAPGYLNFVRAVDLDGDGRSEVLSGTGRHLYVINGSGDLLWKFYTTRNTVDKADAIDLDGDGMKDIVYGSSTDSCGDNAVYALNSRTMDLMWNHQSGFYYVNVIRFLEVDGRQLILVGTVFAPRSLGGCLPSTSKNARLLALDKQGQLLWMFNTTGGVMDLQAGDIDGDGEPEIVVASRPSLYVLSSSGTLEWEEDLEDRIDGLSLAPLEDGRMQVLAATYEAHIFDSYGSAYWTLNTTDRAYSVASADINNDGYSEYVVGSDRVYVYDHRRQLLWNSTGLVYVGYLFVGNIDNLPDIEVVAGADKQVIAFKVGVRAKIQEADSYYLRAQQLYSVGEYAGALDYASQARDIYAEFQDDAGFRKTRSLMELIGERINATQATAVEAGDYLNLSLAFYGQQDFMNSSLNAQIARAKYLSVGDDEGVLASESLMNKSHVFLLRNASIMSYLAFEAYSEGDYDSALKYAEDARVVYLFLRNASAASELGGFIAEVNSTRGEPISDRISVLISDPAVKKFIYPSEYFAANLTIWLVYLLLFGLFLAGFVQLLNAALKAVRLRLGRKTLDLNNFVEKPGEDAAVEKSARLVMAFFALVALLVILALLYAALGV